MTKTAILFGHAKYTLNNTDYCAIPLNRPKIQFVKSSNKHSYLLSSIVSQHKPGFLYIASAGEAFAKFTPHAAAYHLVGDYELRFAVATEAFLPGFHGTAAGGDGHGAKLDAATALLTEIGSDTEGIVHVAVLAPSDKANRPGFPDLGANSYAAST